MAHFDDVKQQEFTSMTSREKRRGRRNHFVHMPPTDGGNDGSQAVGIHGIRTSLAGRGCDRLFLAGLQGVHTNGFGGSSVV